MTFWIEIVVGCPWMWLVRVAQVRSLQKRLISKTEEVAAKDMEIQEKDKLHKAGFGREEPRFLA